MPDEPQTDASPDGPLADDPLAGDPAFAAWSAEVREAWAGLELPSLHDMLLAQERLAAEIRRQNQELRRLASAAAIPPPPPGSDAQALAAALAEARALGNRLASAAAAGLITMAESADRHALALDEAVRGLLARPAGRGFLCRFVPWSSEAQTVLAAQVAGARLIRDKSRQALADAGLQRLAPAQGEAFDPERHRCTGTAPGTPGRIVALVREGWRDGVTVLRPAEVVVGTDMSSASNKDQP